MSANPIWIAAYGGPPPAAVGASAVWIAPGDGTVLSAVASYIAGYFNPVAGASPVWIAGYGGPPPAAIGATPITIVGYGGFGGSVAPPPTHSPEALAYLARTVGGDEGGNGANIATLIDGLVSDGVWAKLDALYVLAQQNQSDALLNLIGTSYPLTSVGLLRSVNFTSYVGFSNFASGVYLNTGFTPATAPSPKLTQNSGSFGGWAYTNVASSGPLIGISNNVDCLFPNYGGNTVYAYINVGTGGLTLSSPNSAGLFTVERSSASTISAYFEGASIGSGSSTSAPVSNSAFGVGGLSGGIIPYAAGTISAAFIGASLGPAGQLALYNRLRTYMSSVGVP